MNDITATIKSRIKEFSPGEIFLTGEFSDVASNTTIRKTLGRLCQTGEIRRVMDGVYEKPSYSDLLEEYIPTDPDAVAYALAEYYHWSIAPCGDIALNKLRLSTQVPMVWSYISDGPYRDYDLDKTRISFKHRTNRDISHMSTITIMVIEALKSIGKDNVDGEVISTLKNVLSEQDKVTILKESSNSADWIQRVIQEVSKT